MKNRKGQTMNKIVSPNFCFCGSVFTSKVIILLLAGVVILLGEIKISCAQPLLALSLDEIKAEGWLKNQMLRDITSGYISAYDKMQPTMQQNVFGPLKSKNYSIDKDGNWEARRETWWPGEHEGYFADLVIRNAFLTGHKPWMEKAKQMVDYVVKHQEPSGYIGIYDEECRLDNLLNENGELWTQSRILGALLAYYEFTQEQKYFDAVKKAVDYTISRYTSSGKSYFQQPRPNGGGLTHGLMYCETLEWLYKLTKDRKYLDFALWLYDDYSKAEPKLKNIDNQLDHLLNRDRLFMEHSVHVIEHFRVPFWLASETGSPTLLKAVDNIFHKLSLSQAPTGTIVIDPVIHESVAGNYGSPYLPYEYCSITETVISSASALQKFNKSELADLIENVTFNAGQAARLPDGTAISYATTDNRRDALEKDGFRYQIAACHKVACCNLNAAKLIPYYVSNMWMKSRDERSIYAMLYGASEVNTKMNGVQVKIKESTDYPFENRIVFTIFPENPTEFSLCLRNPGWSENPMIKAGNATVTKEGNYYKISGTWSKNDRIEIEFDAPIEIKRFINNELYLKKGVLVYAMKMDEKRIPTRTFDQGYANFDVIPAEDTQADLIYNKLRIPNNSDINFRKKPHMFVYEQNPKANNQYPFDIPYGFIKGKFLNGSTQEEMSLIPIGSTILRKVTFKETRKEY